MTMASLFDAINAAAAALNNGLSPNPSPVSEGKVQPRVQPKVQPGAQAKVQPKVRVQPKSAISGSEKGTVKSEKSSTEPVRPKVTPKAGTAAPNAQPTKPTPKTGAANKQESIDISKLQVKFAIPEDFKMAIRLYMEGRAKADSAIARKMKADGKSIDGCCEYIYRIMMRRAAKQLTERKNTGIGVTGDPDEVYGMAMHYYDESEETLKAELNGKEA